MLTPMDIHNKEFKLSFRGYSQLEVNEFLDEIVDDYEKLFRENSELKDRIGILNDKLQNYTGLEQTLNNTLVVAQKTADQLTANAREKADAIIKEAEAKAKDMIEKANQQVIDIKREYEDVKRQIIEFKLKFKTLVETELKVLTDEINFDKSNINTSDNIEVTDDDITDEVEKENSKVS